MVLLIYLNASLQSAALRGEGNHLQEHCIFVGERSDHGCSNILKLGREFALNGLLLPRLPAGRGGWRAPWAAELPTMLQAATGCTSTRREPAVLWVRPSLGLWPVADSHVRS